MEIDDDIIANRLAAGGPQVEMTDPRQKLIPELLKSGLGAVIAGYAGIPMPVVKQGLDAIDSGLGLSEDLLRD